MSDTPETDAHMLGGSYSFDADFARSLERQRNMLLGVVQSLLEMGACVSSDQAITENKRRQKIAREAIASVKQVSPYVGKES